MHPFRSGAAWSPQVPVLHVALSLGPGTARTDESVKHPGHVPFPHTILHTFALS